MHRRPWYGFLYYLLGASGSFFAWVLSIAGLAFTWREAALFLLNPAPRDATVAEIVEAKHPFLRWVRVSGVEIDLGSALFAPPAGAPEPRTATADTILVDADDPAAIAWWRLFRRIDELSAERPGESEDQADQRRKELSSLIQEVGSERGRAEFLPSRALVVVDPKHEGRAALPPASPAPPREGEGVETIAERWRRRTAERVARIRSAVRLEVVREGLLAKPHEAIRAKYGKLHGIDVSPSALIVGDRPSPWFAGTFAACASVLLFLVLGLRALHERPEGASGA
jgi:hypothetical protein